MDEATWSIRFDEVCIGVGQEVVDRVSLRQHAHRAECVDVVVCSANAQVGNHQTLSHKLQLARNDELHSTEGDLQATLVNKPCDIDQGVFQRGFVQVCVGRRLVSNVPPLVSGWLVAQSATPSPPAAEPPVNALFRTAAALTCLV